MNRFTILLLGLAALVLAACGSSTSMEEAHEDEHMEEHDDHDDHHHGHEEEDYEQLQGWLDMRMSFDTMPEPPANMMMSAGGPGPATWEGEIDGDINPSYPDYTHPEIELILDDDLDMHGNIYVHTPGSEDHKLVHHLDAEGKVTGPTFASHEDDENRMTGTFYGPDHGTVVGTVNTAIVIGTYEATEHDHDH